jgi:hypothetical protein
MAKEGYWEGWGFNDTFKVSLTGQAKDVSSAVKELKQAFPKNEVKKYSTKSLYVFVYDNEVPIVKKIAKMFNLKVSYEVGGLAENGKLIYVLYDVKDEADEILNSNGKRNRGWWQSNLNRQDSEQILNELKRRNLLLGFLIYTGDSSNIKFEQGGDIGEALATSNPYIGGAKVIQGIAPQSVSALDKKMASQINPDPNRPIFFKKGGIAEQNKIRKVMHEFKEGELHSSSGQKVTDRKQAIAIALSEAGVSKYVGGGGVDIIAPFGTLVSKNKKQKLEYKKLGSNFEFMIYEGVNNPVSNYSRTSFKKSKNGSIIMNYEEFLKFIYANGFVDDQKYALGGKILASSSTKEGLNKIIEQYLYGSTITLVETENDKIYEVHNKKGKTPFYVEFKRGKYNFIQPTKFDNGGSVGQTDYSVAQTILNQLGGMKRLVIMTGAYNFVASPNAVSFRIKNRKVNYIKITLNGKDLYDLKFSRIFNYQEKVVAELNDIYFDQLIPIFEQNTGMYLKMFKKGGMVSTQNRDMVISQLKTIHHHEQEMLETLKNSGEVEAWVLAKVSNASSDLSDIAHYLEFKG